MTDETPAAGQPEPPAKSAKPAQADGAAKESPVPKAETASNKPADKPAEVPAAAAAAAPEKTAEPSAEQAADKPENKSGDGTGTTTGEAPAGGAEGEAGVGADAGTAAIGDSLDVVEGEGPTVDERLWATTVWMSAALMIFLPPIPLFLAPLIVKKLRKRPSEFISWHAGNSIRFAAVATFFQVVYWVCAGLTALSFHQYWMLVLVPAVTLYTSFAVGMCAWLTLVGHNAWKGRRHRPSEFRNLVFHK